MARAKSRKQLYKERAELAKEVRRFNTKRTKLINELPQLESYLPEKLSTDKIYDTITDRKDFKETIKSIDRFLKPGAEKPVFTAKGIKTTEYEIKETKKKVDTINKRRRHEKEKANVSTTKGTMGTIRANNLNDKKFDINKMTTGDWESFKASVEKQFASSYFNEKNDLYKENYLKGLENEGYLLNPKGRALYDRISKMNPKLLADMFYDDPVLQLEFVYDLHNLEIRIDEIMRHLDNYDQYKKEIAAYDSIADDMDFEEDMDY